MFSDEHSPISPPILILTKYWIEVHRKLRSGSAPTFLAWGNRDHFYMHHWTDCGWMEVVTLLSWQYPFSKNTFDMRKLINRVELVPWTRSLAIWTPWTASPAMQTKPILNQLAYLVSRIGQRVQTSLPQGWTMESRSGSGKILQCCWILSALWIPVISTVLKVGQYNRR